ncbi:thrombospondin type-1 domain-containing protein 4 [Eurytemora carolleeae]|uniref:thrombospondin type-1 domain-containing protein 4 n=1 Tax=Eurytemora carolleeae TaxID=1294199 RepID=UPI000C7872FD|nr:thrombospondin type-1 domain-containing protein 4 [Eurytemora carolleeae]|eukprot:XP_023343110.1 thrombospondin type-1 domain-containing protein 4-like [Eurytemora affinis]
MKSSINKILLVMYSILGVQGCPSCEGEGSTCKLVAGLFTKGKLTPGYTHITTIPVGACSLNITLLRPSANRLGLGELNDDLFINPSGNSSKTGLYYAAGTTFYYYRGDSKSREQIQGEGPLTKSLNLQLLTAEINRGVEYRYMFPMEQARDLSRDLQSSQGTRRRHQGKYSWTLKTLTVCSRSCGGGYQTTVAVCVRSEGKVVPDSRCTESNKPGTQIVRCNRTPCPPSWAGGDWGPCSTSCGEGVQERRLLCRQEFSASMSIPVAEKACAAEQSNIITARKCNLSPCTSDPLVQMLATQPESTRSSNYSSFRSLSKDDWGGIYRTKSTNRPELYRAMSTSRPQPQRSMPNDQTLSYRVPFTELPLSHQTISTNRPPSTEWVAQPWGQCSVTCGSGVKERRVHCVDTRGGLVPDSRCEKLARPDSEGFCGMGPCTADRWLVSSWEQVLYSKWTGCSHTCGEGVQTRPVLCIQEDPELRNKTVIRNSLSTTEPGTLSKIVNVDLCQDRRKPRESRKCKIQACKPTWFTTPWSKCSAECGEGQMTREVTCLDSTNRFLNNCKEKDRPENSKPCKGECLAEGGVEEDKVDDVEDEEEKDWEEYDEYLEEPEFRDVSPNLESLEGLGEKSVKKSGIEDDFSRVSSAVLSNDVVSSKPVKPVKGAPCTDKFKNCNIVVKSRLCIYSYYQTNCCRSCTMILP